MDKTLLLLLLITLANHTPPGVLGANQNQVGDSDGADTTGDASDSEEEPSLVGLFSGLLETLTETASSTSCPGQCVHTIRAFMCEHVMDGANCPGTLKCCTENPPGPPRNMTLPPHMRQPPWRQPPPQYQGQGQGQYPMVPPPPGQQRYPPQNVQFTQQPQPPPGVRPPPVQHVTPIQNPSNTREEPFEVAPVTELVQLTTTVQPTTNIPQTTQTITTTTATPQIPVKATTHAWNNVSCPGVCVSARMASSCEAVYKVPMACRNDLQCCVTLDNFNGDKATQLIRNDEESPETLEDDEVDDEIQIQERRPAPQPIRGSQTNNQPIRDMQPPPIRENHVPIRENHPPIRENQHFPAQNLEVMGQACPGTCITSFFTFFCEQVLDFECPNDGKCCLTQEKMDEPQQSHVQSHIPPQQSHMQPAHGQQQQPQHCPRMCLPSHLVQACPKVLPFPCAQGFFCCIGPPLTAQNQQQPPPQQSHRPVQPHRVSITTTTTTTTEPPVELTPLKPPCPGSCINTILAFTCFRNAEITDIFTCAKGGTKCCAPKTAMKEHLDSLKGKDDEKREDDNQKVGPEYGTSEIPSIPNYVEVPQPNFPYPGNLAPPPSGAGGIMNSGTEMMTTQHDELVSNSPLMPPLPLLPPPHSSIVVLPQAKVQNSRSNYICGLKQGVKSHQRHKRVVGGSESQAGDWCWQVALINSLNQYLCGAALIGTQWVLTAAHCLTNIVRTGSTIYVRVGDHDLTSKYGSPSAQTLRVATTYIHHNHNSQTLDNDIALLKLQGQVELRQGVCLVCLPARGEGVRAGRRCTVTGYGYMGEAGPIPLRIREATLPIISDDDCIRQVNGVTEKRFVLPASSFCAGGEENKDACQGDGGGPLVCQDEGYYELTGLVSWGFGCGREDVPGVYVKVSSFIGWINQIISVNN